MTVSVMLLILSHILSVQFFLLLPLFLQPYDHPFTLTSLTSSHPLYFQIRPHYTNWLWVALIFYMSSTIFTTRANAYGLRRNITQAKMLMKITYAHTENKNE